MRYVLMFDLSVFDAVKLRREQKFKKSSKTCSS